MTSTTLSVADFKSDIRSSKGPRIQRGLARKFLRILILMLLDISAMTGAWNLALIYGTTWETPWQNETAFLMLILTVGIGTMAVKGLYQPGTKRRNYFGLIQAISLSEAFLLLIAFLYEPNIYLSRSTFLLLWLLSIVLISGNRLCFDFVTNQLRNQGAIRHYVFLISDPADQDHNINIIEQENCYTIKGISSANCLDLKNRDLTFEYLRDQGIEEVFVSWNAIKSRQYVCWNFQTAGIILRILPNQAEVLPPKSESWMVGEVPCMSIPVPIIAGSDFWVKRCFDLFCSMILISLLSPVYIAIAILIKRDSPGPILFKQDRIGLHGESFKIWKFRTMVTDAEKLQAALEAQNEIKDGVLFKMKDDPRITPLGKFLRLYSLDELPQLFNVLLGQMSLVGPRPLPVRDVEKFKTSHFIRQDILPGITGLWQVSGRSDIDNFEDGVKLDINYIEQWSVWLDLKILLLTVKVVLQKSGAY